MAVPGILSKLLNTLAGCRSVLSTRTFIYQQQSAALRTETKERLKKLNIPEKPKRPLTPYFRFLQEHRHTVQEKHPDWKQVDVTKQCAEDWKNVEKPLKEKYQQEYSEEIVKYESRQIDFMSSLTQEQLDALSSAKSEKEKDKKLRKMRKLYRQTGKPKRPIGSFSYFLKEKIANTLDKNTKTSEIMKKCKVEWSEMPNDEKEKYVNLHNKDRERYQTEMNKWEAKMIEEGNFNIIRKTASQTTSTQKPKSSQKPKPIK